METHKWVAAHDLQQNKQPNGYEAIHKHVEVIARCAAESDAATNPAVAVEETIERDQDVHVLRRTNWVFASDIGQQVEIFVILVFAAFSFAKHLLRFDELDTLDPFNHLVAQLVLYS